MKRKFRQEKHIIHLDLEILKSKPYFPLNLFTKQMSKYK